MGDKPIPDQYVMWPPASEIPLHPDNLVTRMDWGAMHPIKTQPLKHPIRFVRLNYDTQTDRCMNVSDCIKSIKYMQNRDINHLGMTDIQYNFLIGGDAKVYEGRGWEVVPSESVRYPNYNGRFLEIAYSGEHKEFTVQPSFGMVKAAWELIEYGMNNNYLATDFSFM